MKININIIILTLLLSSCSSLNNNNYKNILLSIMGGVEDIVITKQIKESKFAMQYFELNNKNILSYLSQTDNRNHNWDLQSGIKLTTQGNKIISSAGLDNDFQISSCTKSFKAVMKTLSNIELINKCLIRFNNPESSYLEITSRFNVIKEGEGLKIVNEERYKYRLIEEQFFISVIGFSGVNLYWVDIDGVAWRSSQATGPGNKKIVTNLVKSFKEPE
jgi:hypothetical protein|tara:strand:- start:83 stop:736 length:654 start_codon:yes stop_codon:yes gene_type:complete